IKQAELFDNADDFIADCRNNGRYVTRLTKAILVESFKNVKDNKNKLQDIKKDYKLNLEFTDDGKIVYNKEHVNEILNLLLEHYVTSALTDKRMLAKAIEK
ncbi:Kiwa anti-phage protein KwaB-like domain-containing protein, partial [Methanobrevibacter sp.]|uniref:Kiwa anti-phage protein KwaB-like domain-containing protein n=1 Tax=Methanobrevibacter sp. TaxID=66852 RepID=UPI002E778ED7